MDLPIFSAKDPAVINGTALTALSFSEQQLMWPSPAPLLPSQGLSPSSYLPLSSSEAAAGAENALPSRVTAPAPLEGAAAHSTVTRILIVDDSSMNR